jgi:hypothetical protein
MNLSISLINGFNRFQNELMHFMMKDVNQKKRPPLPEGCIVDLVSPQNEKANELQYPKLISLCQWHVRPDGAKKKQKKIESFTKGITILSHTGEVMMMNANERTRMIACVKGSRPAATFVFFVCCYLLILIFVSSFLRGNQRFRPSTYCWCDGYAN